MTLKEPINDWLNTHQIALRTFEQNKIEKQLGKVDDEQQSSQSCQQAATISQREKFLCSSLRALFSR